MWRWLESICAAPSFGTVNYGNFSVWWVLRFGAPDRLSFTCEPWNQTMSDGQMTLSRLDVKRLLELQILPVLLDD